jgi:hypothetical protein
LRSPAVTTRPPWVVRAGSAALTALWKARLSSLRRSLGPREGTYRPTTVIGVLGRERVAVGKRWGRKSTGQGAAVRLAWREAMTVR